MRTLDTPMRAWNYNRVVYVLAVDEEYALIEGPADLDQAHLKLVKLYNLSATSRR
jgi:hypothetical protein